MIDPVEAIANETLIETVEGKEPAPRTLSPAAERALSEAKARRAAYDAFEAAQPKERGGRGGHDPVRYGDWEKKGIATDF